MLRPSCTRQRLALVTRGRNNLKTILGQKFKLGFRLVENRRSLKMTAGVLLEERFLFAGPAKTLGRLTAPWTASWTRGPSCTGRGCSSDTRTRWLPPGNDCGGKPGTKKTV